MGESASICRRTCLMPEQSLRTTAGSGNRNGGRVNSCQPGPCVTSFCLKCYPEHLVSRLDKYRRYGVTLAFDSKDPLLAWF